MTTTRFHKGAMHDINLARAMSEPGYAIYDGDDFMQMEITSSAGSIGGYVISGQGTQTLVQTALLPGISMTMGVSSTDDDSVFITRQTAVGPFDITINSGRIVAFESRFKVHEGLYAAIFIGLCQAATVTENTLLADSTGVLGNFDTIGFHCLGHATDVDIDGVTRILGGATQTGADTLTEDEDDTFHVYGFRFDGGTTLEWYLDNEIFSEQTLVSATFPTGESLLPTFSVKTTGGTALKRVSMDYWQCVQLLRSEDLLAD